MKFLKFVFFVSFLISNIQCATFDKTSRKGDILKLIDYFIAKENLAENNIIIVRVSTFPNQPNYLTVLYDFNPKMAVGKNDFDKDFGQFKYNKFTLSFVAENGIEISQILNIKELKKVSDKSFINETGIESNYDPETLKFYVDNKFSFIETFHNWSGKKEIDQEIKNYLTSNK